MRRHLWQIDRILVDLDERDVAGSPVHHASLSEITVKFRLKPEHLGVHAVSLRRRIEALAAEIVPDLGSYFDLPLTKRAAETRSSARSSCSRN